MTLDEILEDLHAVERELQAFESKYGILSEDFYQLYMQGKTEQNHDFHAWAGYYEIKLKREELYRGQIAGTEAADMRLLDKCRELVPA